MIALLLPALAMAQGDETHDGLILEHRVDPRFPPGQEGPARCFLQLWVDADGRVFDPVARGCPEPFDRNAVKAVNRWRFRYEPPLRSDEPQERQTHVVVSFTRTLVPPPPARCVWTVGLHADGALSLVQEALNPCALWFRDGPALALPEAASPCQVTQRSRTDRDLTRCPEPMRALATQVLDRTVFAKAEENVLAIVPQAP
jgi:hypothetical protein